MALLGVLEFEVWCWTLLKIFVDDFPSFLKQKSFTVKWNYDYQETNLLFSRFRFCVLDLDLDLDFQNELN